MNLRLRSFHGSRPDAAFRLALAFRRNPPCVIDFVTVKTKKRNELSLHDRLSHLSFLVACKLLGDEGQALLRTGGAIDIDPSEQVTMTDDRFLLRLSDAEVAITLSDGSDKRLLVSCTRCNQACVHRGAALSLILEEKLTLGLAAPPRERVPIESLDEESLVREALEARVDRAVSERMRVVPTKPEKPWMDFTVSSATSGRTYRVALRGSERGDSFCSCPDFRKNTLGTCKHILSVLAKVKRRFPTAVLAKPYRRKEMSLHLRYGHELELRIALPNRLDADVAAIVEPIAGRPITDLPDLLGRLGQLETLGKSVKIYPDAEEYLQLQLQGQRLAACAAEIRRDPENHPLRKELLKTELLPYQLDGIAFAVGAGRAILADDMGLGKTIQGIGVAELLAREAGITRVLIVCPTSLKSQWRSEIERFSRRDVQLVLGTAADRAPQYAGDCFFTVCNYEQVLRDLLSIERAPWDLIVLDEGQRIKNWEAATSRVVKGLKSRFALVLSGTPLENRLDDLHSVIEFVDDRRLGPAFRFMNRHRVVDEKGKVLGYKNLDQLRKALSPVLLRRTRESVLRDLPPRTTEILRIAPTEEQITLHNAHKRIVASIVAKKFISEMDLLRLRTALLMCRLSANSTFLVNKTEPGYSSKLERLDDLFARIATEEERKVVLFSEWTGMLDLIEPLLAKNGLRFARLDGSVPQKKRHALVHEFQSDPRCSFFITTNAGSTGLNLQAANTVVNVDLPWNPAVLEQRIARAHRMGQKRPVQVFLLVTEETIEESLLTTLANKRELALATLDADATVDGVDLSSGVEELRRRLEVLLGARPEAPVDVSEQESVQAEAARLARRERMSVAAGQMLAAALGFLGELAQATPGASNDALAVRIEESLRECIETDELGRRRLTVTLPSEFASGISRADEAVGTFAPLARSLAQLASVYGPPGSA
ncbi:MAG: DEAD/DEAH box helicase [Polyangiales bacterium]